MIIEQIDEKRLMIMLENDDMDSLDLTYEKISWKNNKFKMLIARLLALAKFKTGFSIDDNKLSIETIPQDSGCVIIFTLSPEKKDKVENSDPTKTHKEEEFKPCIYKFENSDNFLDIYKKLDLTKNTGIQLKKIFKVKGKYYVVIYPDNGDSLPEDISVILSEYGEKIKFSKTSEAYLYELGNLINNKKKVVQ